MKFKSELGFTLIELLIVIALLGALAVGLLAALDPFEQLKKGADTSVQNTASEFQGAVIRFYALKNTMPWCDPANPATCTDPTASGTPSAGVPLSSMSGATPAAGNYWDALGQVMRSGELKSNFDVLAGAATLGKILVVGQSANPTVEVCYKPTAKSFQASSNTKYNADGTAASAGTCKSAGGATDCYWCIQ